jgi:hypothetical protein
VAARDVGSGADRARGQTRAGACVGDAQGRAERCDGSIETRDQAVGQIEIELENGIRVRVDTDVSMAALRRVVTALRG